jgi:hypothetical protein
MSVREQTPRYQLRWTVALCKIDLSETKKFDK